jgi:hypothetical protein
MPSVPFPKSSTPGLRPGEGEGRLINAYAEKAGDTIYIRRSAGLTVFANADKSNPRGMIDLNGVIFAAYLGGVVAINSGGGIVVPAGSVPGTDGVTWARNNKVTGGAATPNLVVVREGGGAYEVTGSAIAAYPDSDLPANVNSVDFLDGFFLFTVPDGRIFASDLNSLAINPLSFATAEGKPDGLVRGIVHAGVYYAMGSETIEPWINVGASPFPLQRGTSVIPVGLLTAMAVAGSELGWDHGPYFVAHDGTVRALAGYDSKKVSTPDVEAFIAKSTVSTLEACVYTAKGHAFWVLSSDQGTWEYNVTTGLWNERVSAGTSRWRGSRSVKSNGKWVVGDKLSGLLGAVSDAVRTEYGNPVTWTVESSPMKEYPARIAVPAVFGEFTRADGVSVQVSWSHNGAQSWSNPLTRDLSTADKWPIRVNRAGTSTHHGVRFRFSSSSSGDFSFMGASVPDLQGRAP